MVQSLASRTILLSLYLSFDSQHEVCWHFSCDAVKLTDAARNRACVLARQWPACTRIFACCLWRAAQR